MGILALNEFLGWRHAWGQTSKLFVGGEKCPWGKVEQVRTWGGGHGIAIVKKIQGRPHEETLFKQRSNQRHWEDGSYQRGKVQKGWQPGPRVRGEFR